MTQGVEGFSGIISASAEERGLANELADEALQAMGGSAEGVLPAIAADIINLLEIVDPAYTLEDGAAAPAEEINELDFILGLFSEDMIDKAEQLLN